MLYRFVTYTSCVISACATVLQLYKEWEKSNSGSGRVGWIDHTRDLKLQYGESVLHWIDLFSRFLPFSPQTDTGSLNRTLNTFSIPEHTMSIATDECPRFWKCSFQMSVYFWTYCVFL